MANELEGIALEGIALSTEEDPIRRFESNSKGYEQLQGSGLHCRSRARRIVGGILVVLSIIVILAVVKSLVPVPAPADAPIDTTGDVQAPHIIVKSTKRPAQTLIEAGLGDSCPLSNGTSTISVDVGGMSRKFILYIPESVTPNPPLIIAWHGIASSPSEFEDNIGFKAQADKEGFVVAYPFGIGVPKAHNGAGCCLKLSIGQAHDDIAFGKTIINYVTTDNSCADPLNVFSTGFSNGAFMTHRLGCQAGLREDGNPWIKAIATHSGLIGTGENSECNPVQPVPILAFHGSEDNVVGYKGKGPLGIIWNGFLETMEIWVSNNGCDARDKIIRTPADTGFETTSCVKYEACGVEYCTVDGLMHHWSGSPDQRSERPNDPRATELVVAFFKRHTN